MGIFFLIDCSGTTVRSFDNSSFMKRNQYRFKDGFKDGFIIYELLWTGYLTEIYFNQNKLQICMNLTIKAC